jgi:hypothetical protein
MHMPEKKAQVAFGRASKSPRKETRKEKPKPKSVSPLPLHTNERNYQGSWQASPDRFEFEDRDGGQPCVHHESEILNPLCFFSIEYWNCVSNASFHRRFYLQGDPEFDSADKIELRAQLKKHQRVQRSIRQVRVVPFVN